MSCSISSSTIGNPRIITHSSAQCLKKNPLMVFSSPGCIRFNSLSPPHPPNKSYKLSLFAPPTHFPRAIDLGFLPLHSPKLRNQSIFSFSASRQDSHKPSEHEHPEEYQETPIQGDESEEYWKQTLASFKEQALKMQSLSQEAYEEYSKRAIVILKETSKQLKKQAEKAKQDLSVIAKEVGEEGKEYLSTAAVNSPEPIKDIVETFASSSNKLSEISEVRDFFVGIPYGFLLSFGGFLSFMITGSVSAIRFGVILGGALLALSISSLRSWKKGESTSMALKGQTAIASILFLRDISVLFVRSSFISLLTALVSGALVGFYIYRIKLAGEHTEGGPGNEN